MGTFTARASGSRQPVLSGRPSAVVIALGATAAIVEVILAAALVKSPLMIAALLVASSATVLALLRPPLMATIAWFALVLIPVYAAPRAGPLDLNPAVLAFWLVAIGAGAALHSRREVLRPSVIDGAMGLFLLATLLSAVVGARLPTEFVSAGFVWIGCYGGMRILLAHDLAPEWFISRFILAGAAVLPFVAYEALTADNIFFSLAVSGTDAAEWATSQDRLGSTRIEASFGHAIALAMFMASALVFCLALASKRRHLVRWAALVGAAGFGLAMVATVSRTGWVVLGIGLLLLVVSTVDRLGRRWLWGLISAAVLAVIVLAVVLPNESVDPAGLTGSSASSTEIRGSNQQRQILIRQALDPDKLSLFGNEQAESLTAGTGTGNESVDNGYLAIASGWGIVPACALLLIALSLFVAVIRARRDVLWSAVPAVALANFVGLGFVALITQQEFFIFALAGAAAAFDSRVSTALR